VEGEWGKSTIYEYACGRVPSHSSDGAKNAAVTKLLQPVVKERPAGLTESVVTAYVFGGWVNQVCAGGLL